MYVCTHVHLCTYVHEHIYTSTHACMHSRTRTHTHTLTRAHTYARTHPHAHTHTHSNVQMYFICNPHLHKKDVVLLGQLNQLVTLPRIKTHRFLTEYVFTSLYHQLT